jgi:hypothetical protein
MAEAGGLNPLQHGFESHRGHCVRLLAPLAADRAGKPPTLSSLADEKHVGSLLRSTAARDPGFDCSARCARSARIALWRPPTSSSLGDGRTCPSLLLSTAARAIRGLIAPLAALAPRGSRFGGHLLRRRSGTEELVPSLLLSTAARAIRGLIAPLAPRGSRFVARSARRGSLRTRPTIARHPSEDGKRGTLRRQTHLRAVWR